MKTCPQCSETYSDRIDFCFTDGEVLNHTESAFDAPIPRGRPVPPTSSGAVHAVPLAAAPLPPAAPPSAPHPPPPAPSAQPEPAPSTSAPPAPAAPIAASTAAEPDDLDEAFPPKRKLAPLYGLILFLVLGVVLIGLITTTGGSRKTGTVADLPTQTQTTQAPEPVPAPEPIPAPEPEVIEPPAEAEAPEAEEPPAFDLEPAPEAPAPEPVSAEPTPTPAKRPASTPPRPAASVVPKPAPTIAPAPATPAAPAANPWGMPTSAQQTATVRLTSDPTGASVNIDGKGRGQTPLTLTLDYGAHRVEISQAGYSTLTQSVTIATPEISLPFALKALLQQGNVLLIATQWPGARVVIDNTTQGTLPFEVVLTEGPHTFRLIGTDGQQRSVQRNVHINQGSMTRIDLAP